MTDQEWESLLENACDMLTKHGFGFCTYPIVRWWMKRECELGDLMVGDQSRKYKDRTEYALSLGIDQGIEESVWMLETTDLAKLEAGVIAAIEFMSKMKSLQESK